MSGFRIPKSIPIAPSYVSSDMIAVCCCRDVKKITIARLEVLKSVASTVFSRWWEEP